MPPVRERATIATSATGATPGLTPVGLFKADPAGVAHCTKRTIPSLRMRSQEPCASPLFVGVHIHPPNPPAVVEPRLTPVLAETGQSHEDTLSAQLRGRTDGMIATT
jgi:hypothetical protein